MQTPTFHVKNWETGATIGPPYATKGAAIDAARALGHTDEIADGGAFYIPRAYVVDENGDYAGGPVFLANHQEPTEEARSEF